MSNSSQRNKTRTGVLKLNSESSTTSISRTDRYLVEREPPSRSIERDVTSKRTISRSRIDTEVSSRNLSEVKLSNPPRKNTQVDQLDLILLKMGFTILFSFHNEETIKIILAMTPTGTIVGIKLDVEGNITTVPEKCINMTASSGSSKIESSYLTSTSKNTDLGSIVICKSGVCVLLRDELGKVNAEHYDIKTETDGVISSDCPSSYPLIMMGDIIYILNKSSGEIDLPKYTDFLRDIKLQNDKINSCEVCDQLLLLEQNIRFMEDLVCNLKNVHAKAVAFDEANKLEFRVTTSSALTRMDQQLFRQNGTDEWKEQQDRLYSLNCNTVAITNAIRLFNNFRRTLDTIDQEAYIIYFSMYNRVLKSIQSPENVIIRRPDSWSLATVLPQTERTLLEKRDISTQQLTQLVRQDIASFNPNLNSPDTVALAQSFQTCFK